MSTVARGIGEHEILMMIEQTRMRLNTMGITGPLADRLILILVFGAIGDSAEEARGVADRFFPIATRPVDVPETSTLETKPSRQA